MSNPTCTVLFAGGGGVESGFSAAGIDCVQRIEFDADIAAVNEINFGSGVICQPVQSVDLSRLSPTDYLWASPPCQSHSVARSKKLSERDDADVGIHILDYVRILKPRAVCIENVPPYAAHPVFGAIVAGLMTEGYECQWGIVNAASFGVPQTRKRLILRAVRKGERLLPLTPTHAKEPEADGLFGPALLPWVGWYEAIEDILHTLPESQFAPWQLKRLPLNLMNLLMESKFPGRNAKAMYRVAQVPCATVTSLDPNWKALLVRGDNAGQEWGKGYRDAEEPSASLTGSANPKALLVEGDAAGDRPPTCGTSAEPAFTLKSDGGGRVHRAFLTDSCVNTIERREATCRGYDEPAFTIKADAMRRPITTPKVFIVSDQKSGEEGVGIRDANAPALTLDTRPAAKTKAWLKQSRVVSMSTRALARFQSFPDTYQLPASKSLASKIIGNAVCPVLAEAIGRTLPR